MRLRYRSHDKIGPFILGLILIGHLIALAWMLLTWLFALGLHVLALFAITVATFFIKPQVFKIKKRISINLSRPNLWFTRVFLPLFFIVIANDAYEDKIVRDYGQLVNTYNSEGKLTATYYSLNGNYNGPYKEYYTTGVLKTDGYYRGGLRNGTWSYFNERGWVYKKVFVTQETVCIGAICQDGWRSNSTGRGTCSHHKGVSEWLYKTVEHEKELKIESE